VIGVERRGVIDGTAIDTTVKDDRGRFEGSGVRDGSSMASLNLFVIGGDDSHCRVVLGRGGCGSRLWKGISDAQRLNSEEHRNRKRFWVSAEPSIRTSAKLFN
jgi:hypothetical protein